MLALGAIAMATTFFLYPDQQGGIAGRVGDVGALAFQVGLFGLLATYRQRSAIGTGRRTRIWLGVVLVLLVGATLWSALHLVLPNSTAGSWWMLILDACWPLSMLAFLVTGILIAVAGHWRGPLRWAPLITETWLLTTLGVQAVLPDGLRDLVGPTLMIVFYGGLGVLLAARPGLTEPPLKSSAPSGILAAQSQRPS